jgi:hypothetical protein
MRKLLLILFLLFFQGSSTDDFISIEIQPVTKSTVIIKSREVKEKPKKPKPIPKAEIVDNLMDHIINESTVKLMYATIYRIDPNQCWGNPLITADGTRIDTVALNRDSVKYIAVSQDMLKRNGGPFSYGDSVYLHIPNNTSFTGTYVVHDCMNKRYKRSVDILTGVRKRGGLWKNATLTKLNKIE